MEKEIILLNMNIKVKIQSISDVITNSSTEVFIVYDSSNIDSIKQVIDAILSIDGIIHLMTCLRLK